MHQTSVITPEKFATFGKFLRFLRRKANLTQRELSIAVGYSESQISRFEKNGRAPDESTLAARFVPALYIENEPQWIERLLELGAATHSHESDVDEPKLSPHNLPIQLTSFIGREKEIIEINRLLSEGDGSVRLLTITGHGGCGKTRLALQSASSLLDGFPDGVWLVEFASLSDPALVSQTVAGVVGLKEEPGRPLLSTLTHHLRDKTILLILDNCEHLIQTCAQLVDALLHTCPQVRILATSRETLGVAGERALYVPPLSMPDPHQLPSADQLTQYEAVRLFVDRAENVMPDFTLTQNNAEAVTQICQRLDGIPLAIELAAARIKVMHVEKIAARLTDAFHLLTGGPRTELPRHQTLQAVMDWSYDLLTDVEKRLFNRLSVFAGGWTLEAAEAVCAGDGLESTRTLDGLNQLVNKSLVLAEQVPDKETRFRLLEIIRQYANAKLIASGEIEVLKRRHAEYYLAFAETGSPTNNALRSEVENDDDPLTLPAWLDHIEMENNNLRAVLAWSLSSLYTAEIGYRLTAAMWGFWVWRGYSNEYQRWLDAALACSDAENAPLSEARARVLLMAGDVAGGLGKNYATRVALLFQSLKFFKESGNRVSTAYVLNRLGWLAREYNDPTTARLQLEESLAIYRDLGHKNGQLTIIALGEVSVMLEDTTRATALLEEGLALSRELENTFMVGFALNHLGHVAQLQGEYERARQLHLESLIEFDKIGERNVGTIWAYQSLGETALGQNTSPLAKTNFTKALELSLESGEQEGIVWCLAGLAGVAALNEEPERAAWLWGAAETLRQTIGIREAPASHTTHERLKTEVRNELGEAVFNTKWAEGQSASVEKAIVEATR